MVTAAVDEYGVALTALTINVGDVTAGVELKYLNVYDVIGTPVPPVFVGALNLNVIELLVDVRSVAVVDKLGLVGAVGIAVACVITNAGDVKDSVV